MASLRGTLVPQRLYSALFNHFLLSESVDDAGFAPVLLRFAILLSRSNQKGAPIKIARMVASKPVIFVMTVVGVIVFFTIVFHPRGISLVRAAFASSIFCKLLFISLLICC